MEIKVKLKAVDMEKYRIIADCPCDDPALAEEILYFFVVDSCVDKELQQKAENFENIKIHLFDSLDENYISFYANDEILESEALDFVGFIINYIFETYLVYLEWQSKSGRLYGKYRNIPFYICSDITGIIEF